MAIQADLTEAVRYADFDQPVEMEPAGDAAITDDNPDEDLINELLYGNVSTNGSDVVELMEGWYFGFIIIYYWRHAFSLSSWLIFRLEK